LATQARFPRFALLGVGYIGGAAALAGRQVGLVDRVVGFDPEPAAAAAGMRKGVLDEVAASPEEAARDASLVLLAAPVQALSDLLVRLAPVLSPRTTVIDVGSVKVPLVAQAETAVPAGQFVGCHPMAGAEFSGVDAADGAIFAGRVCFVCPPGNVRPEAVRAAQDFWTAIGCHTVTIEPRVHDRLMAAQSHLPHVAAFALAAALESELPFLAETTRVASPTTSLRDTTRIAASGPAVWRDILLANATHVLPLIQQLESRVAGIRRAVAAGDGTELERILASGQACRQWLVKE